jgi:arylsulfatase A-like enzyme
MAQQAEKKPNILVIWGDDIGIWEPVVLQQRNDGLSNAKY